MSKCLRLIVLLTFMVPVGLVYSQENLQSKEIAIQKLFDQVSSSNNDQEKIKLDTLIIEQFKQALHMDNSFEFPFDSLHNMGKIVSPDKQLRIYTWNIPFMDGTQLYSGFIQYYSKSDKQYKILKLTDTSDKIKDPENQVLSPQNWYGALYYDIIPEKVNGTTYYTLLGFDFNDIFTSKKMIDVFYFENNSIPRFGRPMFNYENKLLCRVIFQFSARVVMSLNYDKSKKMIVFDHLSPSQPSYQGNYRFYGPDFSYDGLKFDDGRWNLVKNVDIRNSYDQ